MSSKLPELDDHPMSFGEARDRGLTRARCRHVVDGDTADFIIDLGWRQYAYVRVRLRGIDTPELHGTTGDALEGARRAQARATELLLDQPVLLRSFKDVRTFDRFVADVWFPAAPGDYPAWTSTVAAGDPLRVWVSLSDVLRHERLGHDLAAGA